MLLVLALHVQLVWWRGLGESKLTKRDVQLTFWDSGGQGSEGCLVGLPSDLEQPTSNTLNSPTTIQLTRGRTPDPDRLCSRFRPQW